MTYPKDTIEFLPIPPNTHFQILTDQQFTRWTVLGLAEYTNSRPRWWCECVCGTIRILKSVSLTTTHSRSCGCLHREVTSERKTRCTKTNQPFSKKLKSTWFSMRARCKHETNYIGRVAVCDRWQYSFDNFITDMGEPPTPQHTIERRENNGNYEPNNCYWALPIIQMNNTRANCFLTLHNKTQTIAQWCRELNLNHAVIRNRIRRGWETTDALLRPTHSYHKSLRG